MSACVSAWRNSDLLISKRVIQPQGGPAIEGDTVRFEIRLENTGSTPISDLQLQDIYDTTYLSFVGADYQPDDPSDDGSIDWADVTQPSPAGFGHPLMPGQVEKMIVAFQAMAPNSSGVPTENCMWGSYPPPVGFGIISTVDCAGVNIVSVGGPSIDIKKDLFVPDEWDSTGG